MSDVQTDRDRIAAAFVALRADGYFADGPWQCCQTCGWAAVPEEHEERAVFYHDQDAAAFGPDGNLTDWLYLAWHGDGARIRAAFDAVGQPTVWDGSDATRIAVVAAAGGGR